MLCFSPSAISLLLNTSSSMICWLQISETVKAVVDTKHYHFSVMPMACCSAQVFKSMKKLWLLEVKGKFTSSEPVYFPEQLRWFCWYMYPFKSFRIKTGMTELVGLELQSGRMKQLHMKKKVLLFL